MTVNGDNRTGPIPSYTNASTTTSTTSAAITPARRRVAASTVISTFGAFIYCPQPALAQACDFRRARVQATEMTHRSSQEYKRQ
jgi:hypothetical protein